MPQRIIGVLLGATSFSCIPKAVLTCRTQSVQDRSIVSNLILSLPAPSKRRGLVRTVPLLPSDVPGFLQAAIQALERRVVRYCFHRDCGFYLWDQLGDCISLHLSSQRFRG